MGFVGVYKAIYDYAPQATNELAIAEGDILYIVEKSTDDDWWKAKKKATAGEDEEPEGLIPNNYVEEAPRQATARSLYEYSRQTDEELSFKEDVQLDVFDTSDPDWTLVGLNGEYGFAPANYIEVAAGGAAPPMPARSRAASQTATQDYPSPAASPVQSPAAALAGIIQQKTGPSSPSASRSAAQYTPEASDEDAPPPMPQRPVSQQLSPTQPRYSSQSYDAPTSPEQSSASPGRYHLYNIHEMISHMGKNKKMPTTLGINAAKGTILIAPEKSRDGPQTEWTAEKLTHYSIEGKHIFMELVKPSRSVDFHAGAKDTAAEIVSALGELAGAARAGGLREVIEASAGGGQKKGHMLYEFMAQGDDEVTVAVGDEVIILDDVQSEEWMMVRRLKNGKEGVVPSSYVEITGAVAAASIPEVAAPPPQATTRLSRKEQREQARLEEERLAREAVKSGSRNQEKSRRGSRADSKSSGSKPDPSRIRTWTDRSGTFKVEAQFLGLKDNKINLHKVNGVKIAVAVNKMSMEDLEFVERATGVSLDDEKPLSEIRTRGASKDVSTPPPMAGAAVERPPQSGYDWFDFFLQCGVNPQICERYAGAFARDQMSEENLQDVDPTLLRTLGLKEGDILRVMKFLDLKFNRTRAATTSTSADDLANGETGLFSGPGGALRNNTRKGRPAPAVSSNDTVDPRAFEQSTLKKDLPDAAPTPLRSVPEPDRKLASGFDDDAWDVKPSRQASAPASAQVVPPVKAPTPAPAPTNALSELSLLSAPLIPSIAPAPAPQKPAATGADPSFFDRITQPVQTSQPPRQRPQVSQQPTQNSLLPPPPQRPLSAPQNQQQSAFAAPPLRPQITGNQPQIAPPGQSMNELNQQRMMGQMYQQQAGLIFPQPTGFQQMQPMGYQQTGYPNQQQYGASPFADPPRLPFQPQPTGYNAMQPQPTGINSFLPPALQPQQTGINGFGQPQANGFQQNSQFNSSVGQNGFQQPNGQQQQQNGFGGGFGIQPQQTGFGQGGIIPQQTGFGQPAFSQQQAPPMPPMPQQQQTPAPLVPQKTGPAPPIRFGVTNPTANKLTAQPTGRRANLAAATPQNPFGF